MTNHLYKRELLCTLCGTQCIKPPPHSNGDGIHWLVDDIPEVQCASEVRLPHISTKYLISIKAGAMLHTSNVLSLVDLQSRFLVMVRNESQNLLLTLYCDLIYIHIKKQVPYLIIIKLALAKFKFMKSMPLKHLRALNDYINTNNRVA